MTGLLSAIFPKAVFGDVLADEQNSDVSITITKFHVNDQTLELGWKIVNNSERDIWILDKFYLFEPSYEVYLKADNQTLLLRRRLDVPAFNVWFATPEGKYVRMRPGEERLESLSLNIPISASWLFVGERWSTLSFATIKRIQLEIGYYDEDLPGLIRDIVTEAEKYNPQRPYDYKGIIADYFPGFLVYFDFEGLAGFEGVYVNGSDEIGVLYSYQALKGEQVLRATVEPVSIPYGEVSVADELPQNETGPAGITMALAGFDINDTNLELFWKIINNTDHDVWLCDKYVDTFMETDNITLILRTRYNLSKDGVLWEFPFPRFRYSRLLPGQEKVKSYSLSLPVKPDALFETSRGNAESAKRLAVEIGYYDENLPGLILGIVEMAEKLNCDSSTIPPTDLMKFSSTDRLYHRFFGGIEIAIFFNSESFTYFRDSVTAGGDEIIAPYLFQTLNGEKVLRFVVENVSIPYESNYPPLND